jgi:hypothetical protein
MQADFSLELGRDQPALELPWSSDDPQVRYYDLRNHPELVCQIPEAIAHPELGRFLARINAEGSPLATAKCDAWSSQEVAPEEEIFGDRKFVSYIDLVFVNGTDRCSLEKHELFAQELCRLLSQAPEIPATVELIIRNCYYHQEELVDEDEASQKETRSGISVADRAMNPCESSAVTHDGAQAQAIDAARSSVAESEAAGSLSHVNDAKAQLPADEPSGKLQLKDRVGLENTARPRQALSLKTEVRVEEQDRLKQGAKPQHVAPEQAVEPEPQVELEQAGQLEGKLEQLERAGKRATLEEQPRGDTLGSAAGFCFTVYVTGFGDANHDSVRRWIIGLSLLQNAVVQLSRTS